MVQDYTVSPVLVLCHRSPETCDAEHATDEVLRLYRKGAIDDLVEALKGVCFYVLIAESAVA